MGLLNRIRCNYCIMAKYAQRMLETKKRNRLLTKTLDKEKILTDSETKNKVRTVVRFLWFVPSLVAIIVAGVLLLAIVTLTVAIGLYYLLISFL